MEILILIARIILIISSGLSAIEAVGRIAKESSADFSTLWDNLPDQWK